MSVEWPWHEVTWWSENEQWSSSEKNNVEIRARELLAKIDTKIMEKLASIEERRFLDIVKEWGSDTKTAFEELQSDINALDRIEEKFWTLDGGEEFMIFLSDTSWWWLSPDELESFFDAVNKTRTLRRMVKEKTLPSDRISFVMFAKKFGVPTSQEEFKKSRNQDHEATKNNYLKKIKVLKDIEWVWEVEKLVWIIEQLHDLEWKELRTKLKEVKEYLIWPDGKSGKLDTILTALAEKDKKNASKGVKTTYLETFAQTARDFSPEVSKRVSFFMESRDSMPPIDKDWPWDTKSAIMASATPYWVVSSDKWWNIIEAQTGDGSTVRVEKDGDLITRAIDMEGADYAISTDIKMADISPLIAEREWVKQKLVPKQNSLKWALSFLENPAYSNVPLKDMREQLHKLLGYELYNKLWVRDAEDKWALINSINILVWFYKTKLDEAQDKFEKKAKKAVQVVREKYRQNDIQVALTLKAIKNSALWKIGMEFLVSEMKGLVMPVEIGTDFDFWNIDLANNNFWESIWETYSPTAHLENLMRVANKITTWSPDGIIDWVLVGYSLDPNMLKMWVAQKTESEMIALLQWVWIEGWGVWSETAGTNKEKVRERLKAPIQTI